AAHPRILRGTRAARRHGEREPARYIDGRYRNLHRSEDMSETKTLSNGVRVIVKRMEGLYSVSMGVLVGTGAAFETDAEDGISHFIEHMLFKGTPTHTAFELSDAFDALGAQVNAFTGKDLTCYYSKATSD